MQGPRRNGEGSYKDVGIVWGNEKWLYPEGETLSRQDADVISDVVQEMTGKNLNEHRKKIDEIILLDSTLGIKRYNYRIEKG